MIRSDRARALVAAVVLATGLGATAGCGGGDDRTGVAGSDAGTSRGTSPGAADATKDSTTTPPTPTVPAATEGLPAGFPVADVPLLDEKVLTGSTGGPDGEFAWSVVLQSSRAVSDVSADVRKQFAAAGYKTGPTSEVGDLSIMKFTGPRYEVGVTAARSDGMVAITYVVSDLG
jgi:hypothetical protein